MKRSLQVLCTFLLVFMGLNAQRYPITVIPRVNPPAPVNFFNYADATTFNSPLSVRLLLNDITITDRQITLKVYFEGNGIQFQSKDFVVGAPTLTISGGEPIDLTNVELAPYFELQNIIGINPNTYGQVIPEGSYQFCFEVFDFITGNRLSDRTCATTYIFRNDPPILNLPANKINLEPQPVDNIVFQWTPRHINVSNVEYELSIVEIWDDTVDPQTAFLTSPPIFQATTRANTFIYGPSNPPLLTDKRYAWQVRAKALQGAEEIGLFRNEGKSEIFWFSRTAPCSPPDNVYAEAKGISKINVFWEENPAIYTEYTIAYREANKPEAQWFTMTTNSGWATVWDLKPGTTYEYKVKGKCKYQYSEYSQVQEISTEATQDESSNYNCGIVPDAIAISNREPYTGLQVGDRITAGDFIITLTDIESSNGGRVTGKGYVKIPYLEFARFGVKYENILVNTDKQLAEGEIVTLYDPEFGEGEQMDQDVDLDLIEIINGDDGELTYVDVDFDIQDITINDDGAIVITGENGEEAIIPGGEDVVITDSDGTAWTVGEDGTVTQDTLADGGAVTADNTSGVQDGEVTSISASGVIVKFRESGFYAFDQYSNAMPDQLKDKYESLGLPDGEEYKVSYKAISNIKGEDFVELEIEITDQNITKDDIIFKTKQGIEIPVTWKDDLATLSIKKKFEYAKEEILAVVKPKNDNDQYKTAGKLNLMHLGSNKVSNIKLVVIPVNNSSITSGLKEKVNDIYNKAGVHFDISITNSINIPQDAWDLNADGKFDVGDSSVLSYYSDEENALNSYIKERINYQEETYYILVFDQPLSEASLSGFMPLKSQFGFVFGNQDQARVIAHELGHGVFGIEHPFTEYGIAEGSTNLLMDYGGGSELNHLDWKQIHAPGLQLYWFQGDEEGQALFSAKERNDKLKRILEHIGNNYDNNIENLTWKYFITKNHGRNGRVAMNLDGEYNFDLPGAKLYFKIKEQPSSSFAEISVQPDKEVFEIKESSVFGGIYYELSLKTEAGDFVFEFDHHDQLEAFCNYFKINRDREEKLPDNSAYSKQIINYLNENYFPSSGLSANVDCNDIDTYFSEIPTSYLTYIHDTQFINNDKLWIALKSLLSCSVNDKGVSEEDAVINLVEALGKRSGNTFLNALKSEDIDGDNAFRKLYSRIDNWGGDDNFTKLINVLHSIWSKSDYVTQPVVDIPYESSKALGFYFSSYDVKFSGDTSIKMIEEVIYVVPYAGTIYGDGIIREFKDLGTYDIYDPIRLVKYKNIVDPGFKIESVDIPMFILKAIAENYSTSNTDRGANFAFEAALTFSGIGNIAKLRHISKLGKLKGTLTGLEGADAILSTTNLLLKYSGACDPPQQNETNQQNGEKKKTFCDKLGFFADVVGLASGFTSLAERSVEIKRRADDLLQEIESNPQIIENATDRGAIIDGLKAIIGETDLYDVSLNELRKQIQDGQFASVLNNFENVKLTLSTVEFLLKYSEGCDRDEVCKQVKFFLDIVQKGIKARDLGIKVRKQAGVLLDKVNNDPNAFKNDPLKKKQVIEELELVSGRKIPSLESTLADSRYAKIKQIFDAASPERRTDLENAWLVLEPFTTVRVANDGKNLEILANIHYRFAYNDKKSFDAFTELIKEGSPASKQKLIDGLEQVNQIFDNSLPVTFTGIKAGDVKVIATKDGVNDEVARYVDGVLQKRKIIEEPDASDYEVVGKYGDADILRKDDEIGFRKITNSSYDQFFKNVGEFSATYDKTGTVSPEIRDRAFELYKQGDWKELEKLFNQNSLNDGWPPANGGYNIEDNVAIVKGQKYDRYGGAVGVDEKGNPILVGTFTSPINGTPYSFTQRALNKSEREYDFYYEIEVIKDLPFTAQNADIIPWYGFEGKGKQSMWKIPLAENGYEKTWNQLAEEGYVKITIISSPSNKFSDKVGTVIQN